MIYLRSPRDSNLYYRSEGRQYGPRTPPLWAPEVTCAHGGPALAPSFVIRGHLECSCPGTTQGVSSSSGKRATRRAECHRSYQMAPAAALIGATRVNVPMCNGPAAPYLLKGVHAAARGVGRRARSAPRESRACGDKHLLAWRSYLVGVDLRLRSLQRSGLVLIRGQSLGRLVYAGLSRSNTDLTPNSERHRSGFLRE